MCSLHVFDITSASFVVLTFGFGFTSIIRRYLFEVVSIHTSAFDSYINIHYNVNHLVRELHERCVQFVVTLKNLRESIYENRCY